MVRWNTHTQKKKRELNVVQYPSHGNQRKVKKPLLPFPVHFMWKLRLTLLWFHKLLNLTPLQHSSDTC